MTTTNQQEWTFRRIVAELPFIPATSNWLKLLCSLLAEPLMFVSSLCIIAETVLPGAPTWPPILLNGPKIVMSLAPEIILPGCFQQAQRARRTGDVIKGNSALLPLCAFWAPYLDNTGFVYLAFFRCHRQFHSVYSLWCGDQLYYHPQYLRAP